MVTPDQKNSLMNADRIGCFSRPDESIESYLLDFATWDTTEAEWDYPRIIKKLFAERFGIDLQKVPLEVSSKGLMPWELACCWIDQHGRGTIQVRMNDSSQPRVSKDAVLTHEAIHAVRGRLHSSKFEEYCAYDACCVAFPDTFPRWRAYLGPLFSSSQEVVFLLLFIWGTWGLPILYDWDVSFEWLFLLSSFSLFFPFVRLIRHWRMWNRALRNVSFAWPYKEWKLMVRLSDSEIVWLSTLRREEVQEAAQEKASREWRWEYFLEKILN